MSVDSVLANALAKAGVRWRSVSFAHLEELRAELAARHADDEIDDGFWRTWLTSFSFEASDRQPPAAAVLILAVQQPLLKVRFCYRGKQRAIALPPGWVSSANRELTKVVLEAIQPLGHWAALSAVPVKLLAAKAGLARYGRNNITYVEGFGSYCKLLAFITSVSPAHSDWGPPEMLERCAGCTRCMDACSLGAIGPDRFLLRAERCLTFYNERAGDFPAHIHRSLHHCLIGCLFCQASCPENKGLLTTVEAAESFGEEETAAIIAGVAKERLSTATLGKLEALNLLDDDPLLLARNLTAVLDCGN